MEWGGVVWQTTGEKVQTFSKKKKSGMLIIKGRIYENDDNTLHQLDRENRLGERTWVKRINKITKNN